MNLPSFPDLPAAAPPPVATSFPSASAPSAPSAVSSSRFSLPDGTPLLLTMSRKFRYFSLTGFYGIATPEDAFILLYLCSPQFDPRERWTAPAPVEEGTPDDGLRRTDPDYFTALRVRIEDWADTFPHLQLDALYLLALSLWTDSDVTAAIPVPGSETPEKKSPESPPTGPPSTAASSPEATSPGTTPSSTPSPSVTSMPPSTPGAANRDSSSSPPPSGPPASPPPAP